MKEGFLRLLSIALQELLMIIAAACCIRICFIGAKQTGVDGTGFLPLDVYTLNIPMLILGLALCLGMFVIIWETMLSKQFGRLFRLGIVWFIIALVLSVGSLYLMIIGLLLSYVSAMGLFSKIANVMDMILIFVPMVFVVSYPVIRSLIPWVMKKRKKD